MNREEFISFETLIHEQVSRINAIEETLTALRSFFIGLIRDAMPEDVYEERTGEFLRFLDDIDQGRYLGQQDNLWTAEAVQDLTQQMTGALIDGVHPTITVRGIDDSGVVDIKLSTGTYEIMMSFPIVEADRSSFPKL